MKSYYTPVRPEPGRTHAGLGPSLGPADGRPHAVVIGSGFGGLASAIRLGVKGYRVTVLEKLDAVGGRAYVWRQDGYTFDAGPTIITAPHLLEELWTLCGQRMSDHITLKPMDPFYRIRFDDGSHFDYCGDTIRMRDEVARFSPEDVDGYDRFMVYAEKCRKLGFEGLGTVPFDSVGDLLAAIPSMVRMRAWASIHSRVASYIRNPKLRIVFSFHPLLIGGNPFSVTSAYALINALEKQWGVHWAMGGTGALAQGLARLIQEQGGTIALNSEVRKIQVTDGRAQGVELADGRSLQADLVVSNADVAWTYKHLVAPEHRRHWTEQRIQKGRYSMSLFVWYFGTDRRFESVPHHMLVLGPRYRELLRDIFKRHHLAQDFSLYLHRPTASDPSMAPPGCDTFYALSPVPHLDSGTDWAEHGERYRQAVQEALERSVLPGLGAHIVTSRVTTPLDFQNRLLSYKGAAFGLEPLLLQSAWFRPHNRSEDIENLYMVGASTHPGAGVPGVLMSAMALDKVIPLASEFRAAARNR
ncbi:MAG: phytoene desaturase [Burkholderiaceae bacterium]